MRILRTTTSLNHPGICYRRPPGRMDGGGGRINTLTLQRVRALEDQARVLQGVEAIDLWQQAGGMRLELEQPREAGFDYGEAAKIAIGDEKDDLWLLAGKCFFEAGRPREALHCFSNVPRDKRPGNFGLLIGEVNPGIPRSAARILEDEANACEDRKQAVGKYMKAAQAYIKQKKYKEAGFVVFKAARLSDGVGKTNLLYEAARHLVRANVYAAALDALEQAVTNEGNRNLWIKLHSLILSFNQYLRKPEDAARVNSLIQLLEERL